MTRCLFRVASPIAAVLAVAFSAFAHFPFIIADPSGATARLIMSETLSPDGEVSISILGGTKLLLRRGDGTDEPVTLQAGEEWWSMPLSGSGTRVVHGVSDLGIQQRGNSKPHVLVYYPKAIVGDAFASATVLGKGVPVELVPVRTEAGTKLRYLVDGVAAAKCPVKLVTPTGDQVELMTDESGLTGVIEGAGRYGVWARHWIDEAGERDGKKYEQVRRYATLVFDNVGTAAPAKEPATQGSAASASIPPLPRPIASFGAVESDGWLYVYGGHSAERHQYSTATVSGRFGRVDLRSPGKGWEQLPGGVPVQGMNLAAHAGKIYRVGGMEPRNDPGEPSDNHSIAEAACFDPAAGRWATLSALPRPRSSHDVLVVDGKLMVIGGWWMKGAGTKPEWLDTVDTLDLSTSGASWESLPQPTQRRALITAAMGEHIFVMGGFDEHDAPMLDVDILHASAGGWSKGPSIPGKRMNGFAPAACAHDGRIYLSVATGEMFRLSRDWTAWEPFATTTPRIVHRVVPWRDELLVIGGAREAKMTDLIEAVSVSVATLAGDRVKRSAVAVARPVGDGAGHTLAARMQEIDEAVDRLKVLDGESWSSNGVHGVIDARAEVDRIVGGLADLPAGEGRDEKFRDLLRRSQESAGELRALVGAEARDAKALSTQFKAVVSTCKACHVAYRD